jgi:hypothetical protein
MVLAATLELSLLMSSGSTSVATAGSSAHDRRGIRGAGTLQQKVEQFGHALNRGAVVVRHLGAQPHAAGQERAGEEQRDRRVTQTNLRQHPRGVIPAQRVDTLDRLVEQKLAKD